MLRRLGRYEEALAALDRCIELEPDYGDAHLNRGNVLHNLRRYEEALVSHDRALEYGPNKSYAHNGRGIALRRLGRREEAIEAMDRALELEPDYVVGYLNRADILIELGRCDEARADHDRALAVREPDASTLNEIAWALLNPESPDEMRDPQKALPLVQRAVEMTERSDAGSLDTLALALFEAGAAEAAVRTQEEALRVAGRSLSETRRVAWEARLDTYRAAVGQ